MRTRPADLRIGWAEQPGDAWLREQRLMILRLVPPNVESGNDLRKDTEGCCPHSCPSVRVDGELARIVAGPTDLPPGWQGRYSNALEILEIDERREHAARL